LVRLDVCRLRSYKVVELEVFEPGWEVFILNHNFKVLALFCF